MPKKPPPETALYVKLPATAGEKLDRAAQELGIHKKDLVAGLVEKYVHPGATMGTYSFQPDDPPEVLTAEQAADLLQVDQKIVLELAEAGKLPGRKLGYAWRFSRAALVDWLSGPEKPEKPEKSR
ncbi:MAG TPA: helix-turn-helix domain-containing protein [Kofleriaceae bacterium]|nr:helix-turn-helix domain-containing protein [Kofleriaceae bacterium]